MKEAECKNKADSINSLSLVELAKDIKSIKNYLPYVDSDAGFHSSRAPFLCWKTLMSWFLLRRQPS